MSELLKRWRKVPTAVIADISAGQCLIDPAIRPLLPPGQQPKLFGRAVTALCQPPDFGAVLRALESVGPGDVLVIDAQGNRNTAMIGEILSGFLHRRGAAGVVCDGAVRDVAELSRMEGFAVYARSITPRGPTAAVLGAVGAKVQIGGLTVQSGDLLIGDDDGVCALTPAALESLIDKAEAKLALEEQWQAQLRSGASVAATFGLDPA